MVVLQSKKTFIIAAVVVCLIASLSLVVVFTLDISPKERAFAVDHEQNTFIKDGEPFRYVAGSFHYFRALPQTWRAKLRTMRAAGLNVVDTYINWALHNPRDDEYNFEGIANVEEFIRIAAEEELLVILRPGPYICAEIDNGGLPYWLRTKYSDIEMRTIDPNYLREVRKWYSRLMPIFDKHLYGNGGSIIMVQVENEYGVYHACDGAYLEWLRDETESHVNGQALLFTTDIPNERFKCGVIDGVFATTDFGIDRAHEMDEIWALLRKHQPTGPLVNSEFYPGWLTHWQEENQRRSGEIVADTLRTMLENGANVNFYMFFGGTNFGFTAGANDWGIGEYKADITSYDYDAVMDEAGDPTEKYHRVRNVIKDFIELPTLDVPDKKVKMVLPPLEMKPVELLLSDMGRQHLATAARTSTEPLSFEAMNQFSGLMLYETKLPELTIDPSLLTVNKLADRAFVFIDREYVATLSRENAIFSTPICTSAAGVTLQILVENQGRINFNRTDDAKGILGSVTVQLYDGAVQELRDWTITGYPLETYASASAQTDVVLPTRGLLREGPVVLEATLNIPEDMPINDTYLDPAGWGKGILYVNGFNLGRYWPLVGPQITMYVPADLLHSGPNSFVLIELQKVPTDKLVRFTDIPRLDNEKTAQRLS